MKTLSTSKKPFQTVQVAFPFPYENIKMRISVDPESIKMLYWLSLGQPKIVGDIICQTIDPMYQRLTAKLGRGIHSGRENFITKMKILTAYLHRWIPNWLRKPKEDWPEVLRGVIKDFETLPYSGRKARLNPCELTAYIMERNFGKERRKHGLKKWTEEPEAFRRTFVSNNRFRAWFTKPERYFPAIFNGKPVLTSKEPSEFISLLKIL